MYPLQSTSAANESPALGLEATGGRMAVWSRTGWLTAFSSFRNATALFRFMNVIEMWKTSFDASVYGLGNSYESWQYRSTLVGLGCEVQQIRQRNDLLNEAISLIHASMEKYRE
jgi:hypothetical protein